MSQSGLYTNIDCLVLAFLCTNYTDDAVGVKEQKNPAHTDRFIYDQELSQRSSGRTLYRNVVIEVLDRK